jgi:Zn finger protein HypA/HybF involved in hydrogenase expression
MSTKKASSFLEKLKAKAQQQGNYGGEMEVTEAKMEVTDCPNCGAGRAKQDGLTKCAYCGFMFMDIQLTDGIHIKKEDNAK